MNNSHLAGPGGSWLADLGPLLRSAREAQGLSLVEAAELLGTTKGHLHSLEIGTSGNPTLRLLTQFVVVYGISPDALIALALTPLRRGMHPLTVASIGKDRSSGIERAEN